MPERSSSPWIIVAVVALVVACCCALAAAVAGGGLLWLMPLQRFESSTMGGERFEQSFDVGQAPHLEIDNFAGSVSVQVGDGRDVHVVITKQAALGSDLDRIQVQMIEQDGRLVIRTKKPGAVSNASVRIEIMAPASSRLDAHTGAGSIEVRGLRGGVQVDTGAGSVSLTDLGESAGVHTGSGSVRVQGLNGNLKVDTGSGSVALDGVTGDVEAHTGSGGMDIQRATGQVRLDTGTGGINYQGTPQGDCRFQTGSGGIELILPTDLNMEIDLHTGSGRIDVDFDVTGRATVSERNVRGTVGSGEQGSIYAQTGSGNISLMRR
jgi:hypothetical protein